LTNLIQSAKPISDFILIIWFAKLKRIGSSWRRLGKIVNWGGCYPPTAVVVNEWIRRSCLGPVSGISYHPTGETNGSMQPSTRQSQNGSSVQQQRPSVVPVVAYSRTSNSNSRQRLQDPYAITVDLESGGDPALPNTMST
jgi:hypothetical protein